jgi:large subunit ribosomal protein L6
VEGNQVKVGVAQQTSTTKAMHGMARKIVLNMIEGVTKGFQKRLMIEGVGYRATISGQSLNMTLGFSHPVDFKIPAGISIKQPDPKMPGLISIEGIDKQKVGEVASQIRSIRPPEPYKGTGIRYDNEIIKRKAGKAAVGAAGGAAKK